MLRRHPDFGNRRRAADAAHLRQRRTARLASRAMAVVLAAALVPFAAAITQQSATSADAGMLVSQEEAFARAARERGTRAAFLEFLAEDGIVFKPGPVAGREYWQAAADDPNVLQWYPSRAAIATSGDLGYTLGPWSAGRRGARPKTFGHYLTIWRRDASGEWRAAADGGIAHPRRSQAPRLTAGAVMHEPNGLRRVRLDVEALERSLAQAALVSGYERAAQIWAIDRSVRMRDGAEPSAFSTSAEGSADGTQSPAEVRVEGSDVSAAADLAYAYGTLSEKGGGRAAFLHVWRVVDGEPYLAVDLMTRLPDAERS